MRVFRDIVSYILLREKQYPTPVIFCSALSPHFLHLTPIPTITYTLRSKPEKRLLSDYVSSLRLLLTRKPSEYQTYAFVSVGVVVVPNLATLS
jgi:hypothetical protein